MDLLSPEETGGVSWQARTTSTSFDPWAAQDVTWLLIKLTPKGADFSLLSSWMISLKVLWWTAGHAVSQIHRH